jgi:hypothetical protein
MQKNKWLDQHSQTALLRSGLCRLDGRLSLSAFASRFHGVVTYSPVCKDLA